MRIANLSVTLGGASILTDISAEFPPGRVTAILGPNGSGKSTLIRTLLGLHRAEGAVTIPDPATPRRMTGANPPARGTTDADPTTPTSASFRAGGVGQGGHEGRHDPSFRAEGTGRSRGIHRDDNLDPATPRRMTETNPPTPRMTEANPPAPRMTGANPTTRGVAELDLLSMHASQRARLVAYVEQDAPAAVGLTVRDVVELGRIPWDDGASGITRWLDVAGVRHLADREMETLSGGERQRAHMARALAQDTPWLLLDEPTNHLDLAASRAMLSLTRDLARTGVGVVAALHNLNDALDAADRVVVLARGRLRASGSPHEVLSPKLVREVWGAHVEWVETSRGPRLL